ncbi:MAG TPA: hypothetical protein VES02_17950, partial [Dermatophilaceae bacterium]|nr:hypothetical protein [Dermatophilaceae bacterium]
MQPSSLIFLVLIAMWAAYLLQHWVRRREHLATARSVDRFSDAMRVLERRSPLSEFDLSVSRPRSYALSPARPSRPEVVLTRAQSPRDTAPPISATAVRSTRIFHLLAGVSARRARGLSLLASLSLVLVVSPLAAFSVLSWWTALVAVAVLAADFGWLRRVAVAERASTRAGEPGRRSAQDAGRSTAYSAESGARRETRARPVRHLEAESEAEGEGEGEGEGERGGERVGPAPLVAWAELPDPVPPPVEVDPSAWDPVPVPPPTYTLKAKA